MVCIINKIIILLDNFKFTSMSYYNVILVCVFYAALIVMGLVKMPTGNELIAKSICTGGLLIYASTNVETGWYYNFLVYATLSITQYYLKTQLDSEPNERDIDFIINRMKNVRTLENCDICLEPTMSSKKCVRCTATFHRGCIRKAFSTGVCCCPICNFSF